MEKSHKIGHRKQASNIHQWKPWLKAGVKTLEGKAIVSQNAWKHGNRSVQATQISQDFSIRSKICKSQNDELLSFLWLSSLLYWVDNLKITPEQNRKLLLNKSKVALSKEEKRKIIIQDYQNKWAEVLALTKNESLNS